MVEEDLHPVFVKNSDLEHLKVRLFSEFPLSFPGGGERLIKLIYNHISNSKIAAEIIENTNKENPLSTKTQNVDHNIIKLKFKRYGFIKFLFQDFPPLDIISTDQNTVSLIFLRRVPPRPVLRKMHQSSSKVVFCLHGIALEKLRITHPFIIAHQVIMRIKLRDLAKYTKNHIFIQSLLPSLTSYLTSKGADSNNIFTIENEFESDDTFPKRNDEEFQVSFIGRMEDLQKGIKRLKKVIHYVANFKRNIKFNIVGTGKDSEILNGLGRNVKILSGIDDENKNNIISRSNLALVTSNLEPYSLVVLEFLTSGVPVVATPASGPSYILSKDKLFGTISSFSPRLLARTILDYHEEWTKNSELYFSRKKEIYYKARTMFNSKKMLVSYENMIIKVAQKK